MFGSREDRTNGDEAGRPGFRERLRSGLARTRSRLSEGLARLRPMGRRVDEALLEEIEELLIGADLGPELALEITDELRRTAKGQVIDSLDDLLGLVRDEILDLLPPESPAPSAPPPLVTLLVGVNGSGKTTTTGKLAAHWAGAGQGVVVAAADTFRAAAVEQLAAWAERAGAQVVRSRPGADPAAVAFDGARAARARGAGHLLVDTAGRLHTKKPLMDELTKIARAVGKEVPGAPHETWLVLDATTGRNALPQAREFSRAAPVTGLILTKLDGTARGGFAVSVGRELGLPVRYVGVGEQLEDLLAFDARAFVDGLLLPERGGER
jgi:fused signal recognition particle receptor